METCPYGDITPAIASLFEMYKYFKMGFLPFQGNLQAQPYWIINGFNIIAEVENEYLEYKEKIKEEYGRGRT